MPNKGKYYESQFEEVTIELLTEAQWQYTFGDELHRKYTDPLIEDVQRAIVIIYKCANEAKQIAAEADKLSREVCPALIQHIIHS